MFQFARFARESRDRRSFDSSPRLFAVFHAFHRLLTPRHPPCALNSLATMIQNSSLLVIVISHLCPDPRRTSPQKETPRHGRVQRSAHSRVRHAPHQTGSADLQLRQPGASRDILDATSNVLFIAADFARSQPASRQLPKEPQLDRQTTASPTVKMPSTNATKLSKIGPRFPSTPQSRSSGSPEKARMSRQEVEATSASCRSIL